MKRSTISLMMAMLTVCSLSARQISPVEAMALATDFMNNTELQAVTHESKALRPMRAPGVEANATESPYYVFNRGEADGFVIISGDDRAPKILGYSDKGSFDADNLPPQLKAMMEQWAVQMTKLPKSTPQHASWSKAPATRSGEGVLLETANWGQGFPYNASCPIIEGANCVTGCVATAMAIVMKYHNWPESYDWNSMPMNTEKDPLDYEVVNPALSGLMADAGEAVYMSYTPWESGADMNWVGHKMQNVFKYSPECQFISSRYFPDNQWENMILENLDNGNPIIYTGSGSGSHAFVLDGYNDLGYHINWGWDGMYNGYFVLDNLAPNEVQEFSEYTGMVFNIIPDRSGIIYSECFVDNGYFYGIYDDEVIDPLNISVENIVKGETFHVANKVATFPNEFYGLYGLALVSKDNEIKEVLQTHLIQETNDFSFPFRGYTMNFKNLVVTSDIDPTDRLQLVSKKEGEDVFRLMLGTIEHPSYIGVVGNTPKFIDLNINVGPGVMFKYILFSNDYIQLEEGNHEFKKVLKGLDMSYSCGPEKADKDKTVILTFKGDYAYGDQQRYRIDKGFYASFVRIDSDYDIEAKVIEFVDENLVLEQAGTLKEKLSGIDSNSLRRLTVTGKINAVDFWYLRDYCPALEYLDIKNTDIEAVYAEDVKMTQFDRNHNNEANTVPEFGLSSLRFLNTLILPESLTSLCDYSLCDLDLQSLTLPAGVTSIGLNVLSDNSRLKAIELQNPEPVFIRDCVLNATLCPTEGMLYVPEGTTEKYKNAEIWQDFKEIIEGRMPEWTNLVRIFPGDIYCYKGSSIQLEAVVYPSENINDIIWSSNNESVAKVDANGFVTVLDRGLAIITAKSPDGLGVYDEVRIEVDVQLGDANDDGIINIADAVTAANVIVGLPVIEYYYPAIDINEDGRISVSDVTSIISLLPMQNYEMQASSNRALAKVISNDYLVSASDINGSVEFSVVSAQNLTALQFDVRIPDGVSMPLINLSDAFASSHMLQQFNIDANTIRIVVYSASGKLLTNGGNNPVVTLTGVASPDDLVINNIFASDVCGVSRGLEFEDFGVSNAVTGSSIAEPKVSVEGSMLVVCNATGCIVSVYSLDGRCIGMHSMDSDRYEESLPSGMYIVCVGNESHKVIIK